jgi:hypothetical protein
VSPPSRREGLEARSNIAAVMNVGLDEHVATALLVEAWSLALKSIAAANKATVTQHASVAGSPDLDGEVFSPDEREALCSAFAAKHEFSWPTGWLLSLANFKMIRKAVKAGIMPAVALGALAIAAAAGMEKTREGDSLVARLVFSLQDSKENAMDTEALSVRSAFAKLRGLLVTMSLFPGWFAIGCVIEYVAESEALLFETKVSLQAFLILDQEVRQLWADEQRAAPGISLTEAFKRSSATRRSLVTTAKTQAATMTLRSQAPKHTPGKGQHVQHGQRQPAAQQAFKGKGTTQYGPAGKGAHNAAPRSSKGPYGKGSKGKGKN